MKPPPLVVAYGMGVDSTAMLVGMHKRGIRPDLILFADTGGEKPETYDYLPVIQQWLRKVGFPKLITVRYVPKWTKHGPYTTLEENCLVNATLPSLAFGRKSCSLKWKRAPQDAFVRRWPPAQEAWARGQKVVKAIGYDAGPADTKRAWRLTDDAEYTYWYPLRDWGWAREECKRQIRLAGLPLPVKSACFFCPASKPAETKEMCREHPDLADRIIAMEKRAKPNLKTIQGLWRTATKSRPGDMATFIQECRSGKKTSAVKQIVAADRLVRKRTEKPGTRPKKVGTRPKVKVIGGLEVISAEEIIRRALEGRKK